MTLRRHAIEAIKQAQSALIDVPVIMRTGDEAYTDVWIYKTQEAAEAAHESVGENGPFHRVLRRPHRRRVPDRPNG